jgi:general secretion pathway protein I
LIEILVALTMFAVIGGGLLQLFNQGLRAARLADDRAHAVLLARSKLTELQAFPYLQPGTLTGRFDDGFRWEATLSLADAAANRVMRLLPLDADIRISWGNGEDTRSFRLRSLLLTRWAGS